MLRMFWGILVFLIFVSCSSDRVVEISIDPSKEFQVIDGFGGFGAENVWWSKGPFYSEDFIEAVIKDLGVTILRDEIPLGFEAINDNASTEEFDYSANDLTFKPPEAHTSVQSHLDYLKAMKENGLDKLILSIWSPPLWMKHNKHRGNGFPRGQNSAPNYIEKPSNKRPNQLKKEYFEEFAEYCLAYIKLLEQEVGIKVYAISLQNEPRFSQWYVSSVYSPEALAELIAVVGSRFETEGLDTKIFGPEDVTSYDAISDYVTAIYDNEEARTHLDIIAIHGYKNDGVSASDKGPKYWKKTAKLARREGKSLWLTETSGPDGADFNSSFKYATSIYNGLNYGNVNAWVFWQMSGNGSKVLINGGEPNWLFYVSKHFYKHIRPGAIRIRSESTRREVLTLSFVSEGKKWINTVIINNEEKDNLLSLENLPAINACWQTSELSKHAEVDCNNKQSFNLPKKSITTIQTEYNKTFN